MVKKGEKREPHINSLCALHLYRDKAIEVHKRNAYRRREQKKVEELRKKVEELKKDENLKKEQEELDKELERLIDMNDTTYPLKLRQLNLIKKIPLLYKDG